MFCSHCGKEASGNDKFCTGCGHKLYMDTVKRVTLKCRECQGIMETTEDKDILMCPFCGSKDVIMESDDVTMERIRSQTYKDVESIKYKTKREMEQDKYIYELEKLVEENEADKRAKTHGKFELIVALIFCVFMYVILFLITR